MLILGLTSFKHDTAAALFEDGVLQAAIENDKLTRSKSSGVPEDAIRFCLEKRGVSLNEVEWWPWRASHSAAGRGARYCGPSFPRFLQSRPHITKRMNWE